MVRYEYDYIMKNTLIRSYDPGDGFRIEIIHKYEKRWKPIMESREDDNYARAVIFGEGCWERLDFITEEEAEAILKEWGVEEEDGEPD